MPLKLMMVVKRNSRTMRKALRMMRESQERDDTGYMDGNGDDLNNSGEKNDKEASEEM